VVITRFAQCPAFRTALCCVAALALAACGGDEAADERFQAAEAAAAKAAGRRDADAGEQARRAKAAKEKARTKRRERRRARRRAAARGISCGGGVSVNSVTSCPFAQNVRKAYRDSRRASVLRVFSPTTGETYTMRCAGRKPTVCRGGRNAVVYIS
jgi:hypothetical protein